MNLLRLFQRNRRAISNASVHLPERIWLSQMLLDKTVDLLRTFRNDTEWHEGIVYWAGVEAPGQWLLLSCLRPDAETTSGSYNTSAVVNSQAILAARRFNLHILAQVHSHPGHWIDHSAGDDLGAFMPYEGFLSVVVPRYAVHGMVPLKHCGVHRFQHGSFRRLSEAEVDQVFRIVPVELSINE